MSLTKLVLVAGLAVVAYGCGGVTEDAVAESADDLTNEPGVDIAIEPELDLADGEGAPMSTLESQSIVSGSDVVEMREEISLDDVDDSAIAFHASDAASLAKARRLAKTKVWGSRLRCHGTITTSTEPLSGRTAAVASWKFSPLTPTVFTDCHITYDDNWHSWNWGQLCTITVHEYGHLSGKSHSSNPRSVMFWAPRAYSGAAAKCRL